MPAIQVGLVGFGLAGRVLHLPLILAAGMNVQAVVTRQTDSLHAVLPDSQQCASLEELLRIEAIDLVVIASPNHLHATQAGLALEAGKHVVVDKPFTATSGEADALIRLAQSRSRQLTIFHNRRWDSDFLTLRSLIGSGRLGEVQFAQLRWDRFRPDVQRRWREESQFGGGTLYDLGSHLIDQAVQLFGPPEWLQADVFSQRKSSEVDDAVEILMARGPLRVSIGVSSVSAGDGFRYRLYGTRGFFIKRGLDVQEAQLRAGVDPLAADFGVEPPDQWGELGCRDATHSSRVPATSGCWLEFYREVGRSIENGAPVPVPPEQARQVIRLIEKALQSSRSGQRVAC
jgi:scyllo-inositol 2-dehydrogenase (NADP+)